MSNNEEERLIAIRQKIDALDNDIQRLISERARCAQEVRRIKADCGDAAYYRPEREAQILRNVIAHNEGPFSNEEIARLFREIMSACLALQHPMRIAYLGPEGTYTHAAALKHFGHSVSTVPHSAIDEVFRAVEAGESHYGVVPVENSTEGVVNHTLDMFIQSPLQICGEVEMRIHHCLLSKAGGLSSIHCVYAHQQALAQCREWLDSELKQVPRVAVSSNAEAARVAQQQDDVAAIASAASAGIYDLKILATNIEDEPDNTTRFLVIGKRAPQPSGRDKTSLLLSAPNKPGALSGLLLPLANAGISMTKIESRPSRRGMWDYVFFIDIEGHVDDPQVADALQALGGEAAMIKVLGSYPVAVL